MKLLFRVSAPAFLTVALLGLAGCSQDNETAATKDAAKATIADAAKGAVQPKTQEELGKLQQEKMKGSNSLKAQGYPGAK